MSGKSVLICGAGIAGPTLAYWLAQQGYRPTLVEQAAAARSSGSPVDVHGAAWPVVVQMGVVPQLRAAATHVRQLVFVDRAGHATGRIQVVPAEPDAEAVEVPRADLAAVLLAAVGDRAEVIYGDTIRAIEQDAAGVDVAFEHSAARRFDLVIGADGTHSVVRRLVFGPEQQHVRFAGLYIATLPLQAAVAQPQEVLMYNEPGRSLALHPARGRALAAFIFRWRELAASERRDLQQQKGCLAQAYAGAGFKVPELLAQALLSDELYFDAVVRVAVPQWHKGRIALLGDAASSVSLFGDGSSCAIVGAYTLARALAAHPDAHEQAFRAYQHAHSRFVLPKHKHMWLAAALLVPRTQCGIELRNLATRIPPLTAAIGSSKKKLTASHNA